VLLNNVKARQDKNDLKYMQQALGPVWSEMKIVLRRWSPLSLLTFCRSRSGQWYWRLKKTIV